LLFPYLVLLQVGFT